MEYCADELIQSIRISLKMLFPLRSTRYETPLNIQIIRVQFVRNHE